MTSLGSCQKMLVVIIGGGTIDNHSGIPMWKTERKIKMEWKNILFVHHRKMKLSRWKKEREPAFIVMVQRRPSRDENCYSHYMLVMGFFFKTNLIRQLIILCQKLSVMFQFITIQIDGWQMLDGVHNILIAHCCNKGHGDFMGKSGPVVGASVIITVRKRN